MSGLKEVVNDKLKILTWQMSNYWGGNIIEKFLVTREFNSMIQTCEENKQSSVKISIQVCWNIDITINVV